MKRHYLFSLTFFLCSFAAFPQATVTVGDPYAVIDGDGKFYFTHNGEILTVKLYRNEVSLQKIDAQTLKVLRVCKYTDFPKDYLLKMIRKVKNRYYMFYSPRGDEKQELLVREIDFVTGTFAGPAQKIVTADGKLTWERFSINFSYDSSMLVVRYTPVPEKKRNAASGDIIGVHVFDANLREKWAKTVTMPYGEKKMNTLRYSVDAGGNVYLLAQVFNDNKADPKDEDGKPNYKIELLKVAAGTGTITSTKLDVADTFIEKLWLHETPTGDMIAAGFYNKGNRSDNADGFVLIKFGANGEKPKKKTYEIPLEILNQYARGTRQRKNDRKDEDGEAEATDMKLQEVFIKRDGAIVLVGEQEFKVGDKSPKYFYNDLLVTKIDAGGNLAWMKKLPKRQHGFTGFGGSSYKYMDDGDAHFFLFLDNDKNMDLLVTDVPVAHVIGHGGILTAYKLNDKTGEISKLSILDIDNVQGIGLGQFKLYRMVNTKPNTLVLEAYKGGNEDFLVKIVLDK